MKFSSGRKLLTFLGIIFATLGVIFTLILVKQGSIFNIGASPSEVPDNVRITNISNSSFTVSYTTNSTVIGTLNFSTNSIKLDNVALDDRDQLNQTVNKYNVHSITVRELESNTTYFFQINSGNEKYINGDSPYSIKTGDEISSDPIDQNPMSGKVIGQNGKPPTEAVVYLKINGAQDLSVLTKQDGSYTIPLNSMRNQSLDGYYKIPANSILSIEARTNSSSAQASASLEGISPVPPITLSQSYDFSSTQVGATVQNSSQNSFPNVGEKTIVSPSPIAQQPTESISPTEVLSPTPSQEITTIPTESLIAENITPTPSNELQPTIPPTGNSSVIMISVVGSILTIFGLILFTTANRKFPL